MPRQKKSTGLPVGNIRFGYRQSSDGHRPEPEHLDDAALRACELRRQRKTLRAPDPRWASWRSGTYPALLAAGDPAGAVV
jgi:hypothetical protein